MLELIKITHRCLAKGTKILTNEGYKPIETLKIGDVIYAPSDGTYAKIYNTWRGLEHGDMIEISLGEDVIFATPNHPILTNHGYVKADELGPKENKVIGKDGTEIEIEVKKNPFHGEVYNLDTVGNVAYLADFVAVGTNKEQNRHPHY
jgi:hypothetical protein